MSRVATTAKQLALSCHPEPVVAVTGMATGLALFTGRGAGSLAVFSAVLAGQLFVGWTNDYLDRDRDAAAGRRDKPVATGRISPRTVRTAALLALVCCAFLSLLSGLIAATAHLAAVLAATAYNLRLKATPLSVLPYMLAFPLLIVFITAGSSRPHVPPAWSLLAVALLAGGAHFAQVLPDVEKDRELGVLGLPQRLGVRTSSIAAPLLLAAAAISIAIGSGAVKGGISLTAAAVSLLLAIAVYAAAATGHRRLAFRTTLAMAAFVGLGWVTTGRAL